MNQITETPMFVGTPEKGNWKLVFNTRKWANEEVYDLDMMYERIVREYSSRNKLDDCPREYLRGAHRFYDEINGKENLLMLGGASSIWEYAIGNGTGTAAQTLTYINNGNAYIGVGDSTTAAANTQTDLQASSNKVRIAMNASFPLHYDGSATKTITAATNATPISVTATSHGYTTGDGVVITGVGGNTNANATWIIDVVDANTFTLRGSSGNSAYTSGGVASRNPVLVFQVTAGSAVGNFSWQEFAHFNGSSGGRMINRKVVDQGTKASPAIWTFTTAISLA